jgi:hypothetical protein
VVFGAGEAALFTELMTAVGGVDSMSEAGAHGDFSTGSGSVFFSSDSLKLEPSCIHVIW